MTDISEQVQTLNWLDKTWQTNCLKWAQKLKETTDQELKKTKEIMCEWNEKINWKIMKGKSTNSAYVKYNSWNEKIHWMGSTADLSGKRRDSVNSNIEQLRLSSVMRKRRTANPKLGLYIYGWLHFLTRVTRPFNGEKYLFNKWCWDNKISIC